MMMELIDVKSMDMILKMAVIVRAVLAADVAAAADEGLEVDYVGVIIGDDLVVREGIVQTVPDARARTDKSLAGYKKMLREDREGARAKADRIIRNTYRTPITDVLGGLAGTGRPDSARPAD